MFFPLSILLFALFNRGTVDSPNLNTLFLFFYAVLHTLTQLHTFTAFKASQHNHSLIFWPAERLLICFCRKLDHADCPTHCSVVAVQRARSELSLMLNKLTDCRASVRCIYENIFSEHYF